MIAVAPASAAASSPSAKGKKASDATTEPTAAPVSREESRCGARLVRTRARKVVVYGDGENPDSGQQLANVISGKGVKNVFYVKGGAPALRAASLERGKSTHPGRGTP